MYKKNWLYNIFDSIILNRKYVFTLLKSFLPHLLDIRNSTKSSTITGGNKRTFNFFGPKPSENDFFIQFGHRKHYSPRLHKSKKNKIEFFTRWIRVFSQKNIFCSFLNCGKFQQFLLAKWLCRQGTIMQFKRFAFSGKQNKVQKFSNHTSKQSEFDEALLVQPRPRFVVFFHESSDFEIRRGSLSKSNLPIQ